MDTNLKAKGVAMVFEYHKKRHFGVSKNFWYLFELRNPLGLLNTLVLELYCHKVLKIAQKLAGFVWLLY